MSGPGFLLIIVAFAFLYFVIVRPQKKRQLQARELLSSLEVGVEVVTAGGIYGRVTELQDEAVMVRIAPELEVRVARKAIGAVMPKDDASEPEEPDVEPAGSPNPENDG